MRKQIRRKQPGQTMVLLSLMVVVIIALVGLSVDLGNTYSQERRIQGITNAAALAGLHSAVANNTNEEVWNEVQRTLSGNNVTKELNRYDYTVDYILANETVTLGAWNGSQSTIYGRTGKPPKGIERLQVTMHEKVDSYFTKIVGNESFTVEADGVACMGDYGFGVYPLGVPNALKTPEHTVFSQYTSSSQNTVLASSDQRWGKWVGDKTMQSMVVRLPMEPGNNFAPGVHISWLNWGGDTQVGPDGKTYTSDNNNNSNAALQAAWKFPGTLQNGFLEGKPSSALPNKLPMRKLQLGDWISGEPGMRTGVANEIDTLISNKTEVMLPIYDAFNGGSGNTKISFHMVLMGRFYIKYAQLTSGTRFIDLQYIGPGAGSPEACGSEPPDCQVVNSPCDRGSPKAFKIEGDVKLNRVWREPAPNTVTRDIVLVMDTSGSMEWDWNDREEGWSGYQYARMNDAKAVIKNFVQQFDISTASGDPDARIAFVTFGGDRQDVAGPLKITTQVNWTKACADNLIATQCGSVGNKWKDIQTKATGMTPEGLTPGPLGFERVAELLANKRTPPTGKTYQQVVLFATDGVFNVCGSDVGQIRCSSGGAGYYVTGAFNTGTYNYNNPSYNMANGRPIWQAQQVAARIKAVPTSARVFIVALTPQCVQQTGDKCFNPAGLSDMSSGSGYYYEARDGGALANIFAAMREKIENDSCIPKDTWQFQPGATVTLTKPENPTFRKSTTTDDAGHFKFEGDDILAGNYVVTVSPLAVRSPEPKDGHTRTYSRVRNGLNLAEVGQASVFVDEQRPNGSATNSLLLLGLPVDQNDTPLNACQTP